MKMQFVPSPVSPKFGEEEAAKVAEHLLKVEKQFGSITPKTLVAVAADPGNYLHKYFTWDNDSAADKYRTWEARVLIASVYLIADNDGEPTAPVRAFVNVQTSTEGLDGDSEPAYVSLPQTLSRPDYQSQVMKYASDQLKQWRKKFGGYKEFYAVAGEIDKL